MRKKGQRGYLPAKSVPTPRHFTKVNDNEDIDSGVSRAPVDVYAAVATNFNASNYIRPVPMGVDPFAGDETSIRKKVVFRPSKAQMGAIVNKKKHGQVIEHSGESGYAPVKHEKKFLAKNSDKVVPVWSVPTIDQLAPVDTSGIQQAARPSSEHNPRQEEPMLHSINAFDYQPFFSDSGNLIHAQSHRKVQSIQEVVQSRIQIAQELVMGSSGAEIREMSARARFKSEASTAGRIDEESQGNQWGDYASAEKPEYDAPNLKVRRQRSEGDYDQTAEPTDFDYYDAGEDFTQVKNHRRVQFAPEAEYSNQTPDVDSTRTGQYTHVRNAYRHQQTNPTDVQTQATLDVDDQTDRQLDYSTLMNARKHQVESDHQDASNVYDYEGTASQGIQEQSKNNRRVQAEVATSQSDRVYDANGQSKSSNGQNNKNNRRYQVAAPEEQTDYQPDVNDQSRQSNHVGKNNRRYQVAVPEEQTDYQLDISDQPKSKQMSASSKNNRRIQAQAPEEQTEYQPDGTYQAKTSNVVIRNNRRYQVKAPEEQTEYQPDISDQTRQSNTAEKNNRRYQAEIINDQTDAQLDVGDQVRPSNLTTKNNRRHQIQAPEEQAEYQLDVSDQPKPSNLAAKNNRRHQVQAPEEQAEYQPDISDQSKASNLATKNSRRHQAHPTKKQSHASMDVKSVVSSADVSAASQLNKKRTQTPAHEKSNDVAVVDAEIRTTNRNEAKRSTKKDTELPSNKYSQRVLDDASQVKNQLDHQKRVRKVQAEDASNNSTSAKVSHEADVSKNGDQSGPVVQRRQKQASDESHQIANPETAADVRNIDRLPKFRPTKSQAEPEGVYVAQRLVTADPRSRMEAALARVKKSQNVPDATTTQTTPNVVGTTQVQQSAIDPQALSNRRQVSAKPESEQSQRSIDQDMTIVKSDTLDQETMTQRRQFQPEAVLDAGQIHETNGRSELEKAQPQRNPDLVDVEDITIHSGYVNPNDADAGFDPQILNLAESKNNVARDSVVPTNISVSVGPDSEGRRTGLEVNARSREPIIKSDINSGANHTVAFRKTHN